MLLRAALAVLFVLLTLFAWRGWNELPRIARLAAAAATMLGVVLFLRMPGALAAALLLTWALASWLSARRR